MSERLDNIVEQLLASYSSEGGINHIDRCNLPSKQSVGILCEDFIRLLFPGFLEDETMPSSEIALVTRERILALRENLSKEIRRSLRVSPEKCAEEESLYEDYSCQLLEKLPAVRQLLSGDVEAAYEGDPAAQSVEEIILAYPTLEAVAIQRIAHVLYNLDIPLLPRMMTEWAHSRTGVDIHPGASIGSHFFIDHGTGVVIGETTTIGNRVKLYHGVTLGARSFEKDEQGNPVKGIKRHPDVEDNVVIYANATILGGETVIGKNSIIGANVFIMRNVDPGSVIVEKDRGKYVNYLT